MGRLEELKKEMLAARDLYETFQTKISRSLTEEEKTNLPQTPKFIGVEYSEIRMFELTKDRLEEIKQLELNMKEAQRKYVEYLMSKENKKEKIFINGFEYYLDRENLLIYDKDNSNDGISIYSNRLTKNEKEQIKKYL